MKKVLTYFVSLLALCGGLLHLVNSAAGLIVPLRMRPLHLGIIAVLAILLDVVKSEGKKHSALRNAVNLLLLAGAVAGTGYIGLNYEKIAKSAGYVTPEIVIFGSILVAVVLVISWKTVGPALSIVAGVFFLYALFGQYLPGFLGHRGYSFSRVINFLYTNGNGIFGVPIDTSARYLVLFMIMAEFIERSGTGKLFMAIADFIAKRTRGGAAKSSIVASALLGSISGTPIANVMVTGAFTIPMMKKSGFTPTFAAGVEATASTGGLIMPPSMGAGAFIMAELLGITYGDVMLAAIIPAPRPEGEDYVVHKRRFNAFYQTELEHMLRCWGIKTLIVTGVITEVCVESTVREAFIRDFDVLVDRDGVGSWDPKRHEASLVNMGFSYAKVAGQEELLAMINGAREE